MSVNYSIARSGNVTLNISGTDFAGEPRPLKVRYFADMTSWRNRHDQ